MEFGGAFADTLESVSARFSGVWLISLGSNSGTPFLPESGKTCQHYFVFVFWKPIAPRAKTQRGIRLTFYKPAAVSAAKNTSSVSRVVPAKEQRSQATRLSLQ